MNNNQNRNNGGKRTSSQANGQKNASARRNDMHIPQQASRNDASLARERAIRAEKMRVERIRRAKMRKRAIEKITAVTVFALIGAVIALAIIFSYIFIDFRSSKDIPDEAVVITLSDDSKTELSKDYYFYRNGEYYVSLTKLASLCNLTLHGDVKKMTLSFSDGSYAAFNIGYPVIEASGTNCVMSNPSYFEYEQLFIPASFFEKYCDGVTVTHNEKGKDKGFNIVFDKRFDLSLKKAVYAQPITDDHRPKIDDSATVPEFKADLSAYEMYMNPENKDEYLTLINTKNMLSSDYVPSDLVPISDTRKDGRSTQQMRLYAAKSLEALFIEMRANGFSDVSVTSGYRSYSYQQSLLDREIAYFTPTHGDKAREKALTQVALPGSSEHQSGLCIDMHNLPSAHEKFASEDAYKWLYSNCADFGFILRFPKDKTAITGIIFEPWHYRYVGRYHAQKIMESGLCLEEYIEQLEN